MVAARSPAESSSRPGSDKFVSLCPSVSVSKSGCIPFLFCAALQLYSRADCMPSPLNYRSLVRNQRRDTAQRSLPFCCLVFERENSLTLPIIYGCNEPCRRENDIDKRSVKKEAGRTYSQLPAPRRSAASEFSVFRHPGTHSFDRRQTKRQRPLRWFRTNER
ncbi:hypothetical protein TNCV_2506661 [Trichonephila clavipes]|uniref:Uncharacterized protein n=1 Tax=Trichonephila clavipes TaxID=2585209 RepID=A0A8X6WG67_TRICX|nr:hypothetical protein TNCV_2506661 [Trichonephila clavipes]